MEQLLEQYSLSALVGLVGLFLGLFIKKNKFGKDLLATIKEDVSLNPYTAKEEREAIKKEMGELKVKVDSIEDSVNRLFAADLDRRMEKLVAKVDYYKGIGYANVEAKTLLKSQFENYFNDGGNHITEDLLKEVLELPSQCPEDEE